ncbi:MAG TPA: methyltransferase domain-containing protein [Terrimicrobiaceae bacterium]
MPSSFQRLQKTWESLGEDDPLWAIVSEPDKKGGRWETVDFLKSGDEVVDRYLRLLQQHGGPETFEEVLDFGCGVGRLTLSWSRHARTVTGVDISRSMIERGRRLLAGCDAITLELNQAEKLSIFSDERFDLVFSHIVLQHLPWGYAKVYLREFARVCRPGGWVAFQLPTCPGQPQFFPRLRRSIVDHLPFGLGEAYRRQRKGSSVLFDMHFTSPDKVKAVLSRSGLNEIHREPDDSAGAGTKGFVYLYRKPPV